MNNNITNEQKQVIDAMFDENTIIKRNGAAIRLGDRRGTVVGVNSMEDVMVFMYALLHEKSLYRPELSIANPKPSAPRPGFVFPPDLYLFDEQKKMHNMALAEFVEYGCTLIKEKNIPSVGVVAGIDYSDTARVTATVFTVPEIANALVACVEGDDYKFNYYILVNATGKSPEKNQKNAQKYSNLASSFLISYRNEEK